jgi:hypothetical protein
LCGRLDTLGNDFQAEVVRHRDQGSHDCGVIRAFSDLHDEAAIDLYPRQGKFEQVAQ